MTDLEREYVMEALNGCLKAGLFLLPKDVQRQVRLAQSVLASHGMATAEEMQAELGNNLVIARRTKRIVEKYGADVKCVTAKEYDQAQRRAIEHRYAIHLHYDHWIDCPCISSDDYSSCDCRTRAQETAKI